MEVIIGRDSAEIADIAADAIESLLNRKPDAVLGLATGSSPLAIAHWWTVWALVLGSLLVGRVLVPLRRNAQRLEFSFPDSAMYVVLR
jgi:hypothetical protein